jgi:hypothetical protein
MGAKPVFLRPLQNITVSEGQRAEMRCIIKSTPDTQVKWYNNGNPVEQSAESVINFNRLSGICTLEVAEARSAQHSGQYTCVASNAGGSESSIAWLVVKTPGGGAGEQLVPHTPRLTKLEPPMRGQQQQQHQQPLRLGVIESSKVDQRSPVSSSVSPQKVEIVRAYQRFPDSSPARPQEAEEPAEQQPQPSFRQPKAPVYHDDVFEPVSYFIFNFKPHTINHN